MAAVAVPARWRSNLRSQVATTPSIGSLCCPVEFAASRPLSTECAVVTHRAVTTGPPRRDLRPALSRRRRDTFGVSFSPAASDKALKAIRQTVRSWTLHERSDKTLDDLARMFDASIRGWINYNGRYYKSALYPTLRHIDRILARWAHRKFKSLRRHRRRTQQWLARIAHRQPALFAHWGLLQGYGRTMGAG